MGARRKGRGAQANPPGRFETVTREPVDDGWSDAPPDPTAPATTVATDAARSALTWNDSPDLPFDRSVNPYRGCEHGCIYCYARPSHAFWDLSPGLDFETRLLAKPDAAALLEAELARTDYRPAPIALGSNTDPYQPVEKRLGITRSVLEVLARTGHPATIVTKSALVERDLDLLTPMAERGQVSVTLSLTTRDRDLSRVLEPRAAAPERRLATLRTLTEAGVPTGVLVAPVIPMLTDNELEDLLGATAEAGAEGAGYVLLRLPHEVTGLFEDWLAEHYPLKAERILARLREARGGGTDDPQFGRRLRGTGAYADLIQHRFDLACRRTGLSGLSYNLSTQAFRPPTPPGTQLGLL